MRRPSTAHDSRVLVLALHHRVDGISAILVHRIRHKDRVRLDAKDYSLHSTAGDQRIRECEVAHKLEAGVVNDDRHVTHALRERCGHPFAIVPQKVLFTSV